MRPGKLNIMDKYVEMNIFHNNLFTTYMLNNSFSPFRFHFWPTISVTFALVGTTHLRSSSSALTGASRFASLTLL